MRDEEEVIANKRNRATQLLGRHRYEMALTAFREVLTLLPDDAFSHACLSVCLTQMKQLDSAEESAQVALALCPDDAFAHHSHSLCMAARNRLPEAEASARQALRYSPDNPDYHAFLAALLGRQRRWTEAVESIAAGLRLDPENPTCLKLRATVALAEQDEQSMDHAVGELVRISPDEAAAHAARGFRSMHQMEADQAASAFREALRADPTLQEARIGLAYCLRMQSPIYAKFLVLPHSLEIHMRNRCWIFTFAAALVCWGLAAMAAQERDLDVGSTFLGSALTAAYAAIFAAFPLANVLTLRLHREGKFLLPREQFWTGYAILGLGLAALAAAIGLSSSPGRLMALAIAAQIPSVSQIAGCKVGWPRRLMQTLAGITAVCGLALAVSTAWINWISPGPQPNRFLMIAITTLMLAVPIASHYLTKARVRR